MTRRLPLALLLLALLAAACSSDSSTTESAPSASEPVEADAAEPAEQDDDTAAVAGDADDADGAVDADEADDSASASEPEESDESGEASEPAEPVEPEAPAFAFHELAPLIATFVEQTGINGAAVTVVHRDHGVIYEHFEGIYDENRVSLIASSSKTVAAGVLLHLHDEGLLDIDAPIADVADWGADNPTITPAQLVSNSSGLVAPIGYGPYGCQLDFEAELEACGAAIMTTPDDDADVIAPDTAFAYGGGQWQVAGAVAEAASGKSWAELIDEIYIQPCGLETFGWNNHFAQLPPALGHPSGFDGDPGRLAPTDNPNIEGGGYSNSRDYAALMLMQLRDGMCGDEQVLSVESLARMHGDEIAVVYDGTTAFPGWGYGMGWWVERNENYLTADGAFGSTPMLDLEDGYGIHVLTESDTNIPDALLNQLRPLVDTAIADAVAG